MPGGKGFRGGQFSSPHRNRRRLQAAKNSLRRMNAAGSPRFCRIRGNATDRASLETLERFLSFEHSGDLHSAKVNAAARMRRLASGTNHGCYGGKHAKEYLIRAARRGNEKPSVPKCSEGL